VSGAVTAVRVVKCYGEREGPRPTPQRRNEIRPKVVIHFSLLKLLQNQDDGRCPSSRSLRSCTKHFQPAGVDLVVLVMEDRKRRAKDATELTSTDEKGCSPTMFPTLSKRQSVTDPSTPLLLNSKYEVL